jgi:hypothetical protein
VGPSRQRKKKENKEKAKGKGGEERAAGGLVRWLLGWSGSRVGPVAAFLLFFVLVPFLLYFLIPFF